MKLQDVLVGAVASLFVTVLGGMGVYYFTKEPDIKKSEKLIYDVRSTASFKGGSQNIEFTAIRIANEGGVAANKVTIDANLKSSQIRDIAIDSRPGLLETERQQTPQSLHLGIRSLLPGEFITLNLLLTSPERPDVALRSEATLGTERAMDELISRDKPQTSKVAGTVGEIALVLLAGTSMLMSIFLRRRGLSTFAPDKNNTGFLLLHHGLVEEAEIILTSALRSGHYDSYTLSNLAFCKALRGQNEQAEGLIRAASFKKNSGHAKAIVLFNEALIYLIAKKNIEALAKFKEARALSPSDIKSYCKHTVYFDIVRSDPSFYELIRETDSQT